MPSEYIPPLSMPITAENETLDHEAFYKRVRRKPIGHVMKKCFGSKRAKKVE